MFRAAVCAAAILAATGIASGAAAGPALPDRPGPWQQIGPAAVSKLKPISTLRIANTSPTALAVVVTGPVGRRLRVFWATDCEVFSDDVAEETNQGSVSGTAVVVAYPPVLADATRCYVMVRVRPPAGARVTAATYAY